MKLIEGDAMTNKPVLTNLVYTTSPNPAKLGVATYTYYLTPRMLRALQRGAWYIEWIKPRQWGNPEKFND